MRKIVFICLIIILISTFAVAETVYVKQDGVNIRYGPGTNYKKIGKADRGMKFEVLGKKNNWYRLDLGNEKIGWIFGELLINNENEKDYEEDISSNIPNGYKNVKWGDSRKIVKQKTKAFDHWTDDNCVFKSQSKHEIKDKNIENIEYCFYKDKLYYVKIQYYLLRSKCTDNKTWEVFFNKFTKKYGNFKKSKSFNYPFGPAEEHKYFIWEDSITKMELDLYYPAWNWDTTKTDYENICGIELILTSKKIKAKIEEAEKEKKQKEEKKIEEGREKIEIP